MIRFTPVLLLLFALACTSAPETTPDTTTTAQEASPKEKLAKPPASWVKERVEDANARLGATPAGQKIAASIKAHGGLDTWFNNGPVRFQFRYQPVNPEKATRDTIQVIDTWSARAHHTTAGDAKIQFGWDGKTAWKSSEDLKINPRFWALTPFYFVGIPFVLADKGITLTEDGTTEFEGKTYDLIRATFAQGTGDSPGDYYIVYLDQEDKTVAGVRYVVSYKGFFPDGGRTPEKFMKYDGAQTIDGITFPKTFRTFSWDKDANKVKELATNSTMSQVSFVPELKDASFAPPEGAILVDTY